MIENVEDGLEVYKKKLLEMERIFVAMEMEEELKEGLGDGSFTVAFVSLAEKKSMEKVLTLSQKEISKIEAKLFSETPLIRKIEGKIFKS